jgi:hypothetical protein
MEQPTWNCRRRRQVVFPRSLKRFVKRNRESHVLTLIEAKSPAVMTSGFGVAVAVKSGVVTFTTAAAAYAASQFLSPEYLAVMLCIPAVSVGASVAITLF